MKLHLSVIMLATGVLLAQAPCEAPVDEDGDGFTVEQGDCNDADATIYPGAAEICDGKDNDCDALSLEECPSPALRFTSLLGEVAIQGADNGRTEPAEYADGVTRTEVGLVDEELAASLEYVGSAASMSVELNEAWVLTRGASYASGKDDYGYGQGWSDASSHVEVSFDTGPGTFLVLAATLGLQSCSDGGEGTAEVLLLRDGETLFSTRQAGSKSFVVQDEGGIYTLVARAEAGVAITGGGDAYPCGKATFDVNLSSTPDYDP